jgi:hypothetical protein
MATSSQEGAAHRRLDVTEGPERPLISSISAPPPSTTVRFRRLVAHLHRLGVRPTGELLAKLGRDHDLADEILVMLEEYSALDAAAVARLGGDDWPPVPIEVVR